MQTIQAMVNPRLLSKASRLFTGTLEGRIIEVLQNARRAGATEVDVVNEGGFVTVSDNGQGIDDFARLLDLGGSGWEESLEESEDPAGVGLFCLAPREVTIRSNGQIATTSGDGWMGEPVEIQNDPESVQGTVLRFQDEPWTSAAVDRNAVFCGMGVTVDGKACPKMPFMSDQAASYRDLGCRIEVREAQDLNPWHTSCKRGSYHTDNVLVNFHGQVVAFDCHPVSEHHLHFLVDMTDEATGIRMMLPARTRLVENGAFERLKSVLELEAFRYLERRGHHRLPYKEYLRAKELGINLPEATPTFSVGLLGTCEPPEPVEVAMPKDFPLAQCYRFDPDYPDGAEGDEANVHLLAALGTFSEPFVPVEIHKKYDGYSWAKLPTIGKVELKVGKEVQSRCLWSGTLTCVESIKITAHASNGMVFSSAVCMAMAEPPVKTPAWADDHVLVTPTAQERLTAEETWHHFGGWYEDGDTYDTQLCSFEQELDRFWADLLGPEAQLRRQIIAAMEGLEAGWKSVKVFANGKIRISYGNHRAKTITAPRSQQGGRPEGSV